MRISIRKNDPGYHPELLPCHVYLDGQELFLCFTADEEEGKVYCFEKDDHGKYLMDPDNPQKLKEITLSGNVKIVALPEDKK